MFDEPNEPPAEDSLNPADRAREKLDEFRMHAELAAVFEGPRKFEAQVLPGLDAQVARDVQKGIARLEKSKSADIPLVPNEMAADARSLLSFPETRDLSTNDYHIHRRPGEVMIVRWLAGDEVETFYERLQAHFDAALNQYREEEKSAQAWKHDPATQAYLDALDGIELQMSERYLRDVIRKHRVFVLSTQSADEMDILHLCDYLMGAPPEEIVGRRSAPPESPTQQDRAWFFKLFSLRGISDGVERMCFFTYLQKSDDTFDSDE